MLETIKSTLGLDPNDEALPTEGAHPPTTITVLISGSGSNLQALIDAIQIGLLSNVSIVRVISNRKDAYGLKRASNAGIPTTIHNLISGKYHKKGETDKSVIQSARQKYDTDLAKIILEDKPDLVVCAGFMHILAPTFLQPLEAAGVPVINLHPALPKMYDGTHAIERAYADFQAGTLITEDGDKDTTGIMIHYVVAEVDRGEPIVVRKIKCKLGETLEQLTERIHENEHELIVEGTGMAISNVWEKRNAKA